MVETHSLEKIKEIYEGRMLPPHEGDGFSLARRLESEIARTFCDLEFDSVVREYMLGNARVDIACFLNKKQLFIQVKTSKVHLSDLGRWADYAPFCDKFLIVHKGLERKRSLKNLIKKHSILLLSYRDLISLFDYVGQNEELKRSLVDFLFNKYGEATLQGFKEYCATQKSLTIKKRKVAILYDPIYGRIVLTDIEWKLVDTVLVQRLRRIRELGLTYTLYPSATHTRFEHSIGCLVMADRILRRINTPEKEIRLARLAALLHDIGHGPFSHISEEIVSYATGHDVSCENIAVDLIQNNEEISTILDEKVTPVKEILCSRFENNLLNEVLNGAIDADKLDYIQRDSYFLGLQGGSDTVNRLLSHLTVKREDDKCFLEISGKGKDSIDRLMSLKAEIYKRIYGHQRLRITDAVWISALKWLLDENILNKDAFTYRCHDMEFLEEYTKFDDYTLCDAVIQQSRNLDPEIVSHLKTGRSFVSAFVSPLGKLGELYYRMIEGNIDERSLSRTISERADLSRELVILDILGKHYSSFRLPEILRTDDNLFSVDKLFVYSPIRSRSQVKDATEQMLKEL
jgi:HD superfamily phosphohydrolase